MREKWLALLLSGALSLSLGACASGEGGPEPVLPPSAPALEESEPALSTPEPVTSPGLETETPEPSERPDFGDALPRRDYQPWQEGYMEFLTGLLQAELDSRGKLTEAGEYYWPAYEGLAADQRGVLCMDAGEELRMTLVMAMGSESYSLYDVDKDGVPELFVKYGNCEAAFTYQCYTFRDGQVVCIGEFDGGHSALYTRPDKCAVVRAAGHMGYAETYEYPMENGVLTEEREIFSEEDVWDYTPMEEIVPGAEYIEYFYTWRGTQDDSYFTGKAPYSLGKALLLPIADWQAGPAATGDSSERARTAILAALSGETEVYGVSGDHFYGDTGPTTWEEYLGPHGAYPYNDEPLAVSAHLWQDMNGDGQEELLLRVVTREAEWSSESIVMLSEQDGTVYAYFLNCYDRAELHTDGTILDTYGKSVRLSFWKDQCYEYAEPETEAPPVQWLDGAPVG